MPAQKRSSNHQGGEEHSVHQPHRQRRKQSRRSSGDQSTRMSAVSEQQQYPNEQQQDQERQEDQPPHDGQPPVQQNPDEDSDGSGTDPEEFDEVIAVIRSEIRNNDYNERHFFAQLFQARKDVECPICLGIIKKTRTVMGCLHRFCRECIDKSMRLGNNECPACRIHCASRRSLRDDLDYDELIDAIYPDVLKYEEEELVFHEEEKTRNEQIQASIAQISRRQSEALYKRRRTDRDGDDLRVPRYGRNTSSRRRNNQRTDLEVDDDNQRENDLEGSINPSPPERSQIEIKQRRHKRRSGTQPPPTSPTANPDSGNFELPMEPKRDDSVNPLGSVHNPEILTWGRGGARSHTRHGSSSGSRGNRESRISRLIEHFKSESQNNIELGVPFAVFSLDKESIPSLERPFLCCPPSFSVDQLRKYVAGETKSQAEDVEVMLVKANTHDKPPVDLSNLFAGQNHLHHLVDWSNVSMETVEGQETVAGLHRSSNTRMMILGYVCKKDNQQIQLSSV